MINLLWKVNALHRCQDEWLMWLVIRAKSKSFLNILQNNCILEGQILITFKSTSKRTKWSCIFCFTCNTYFKKILLEEYKQIYWSNEYILKNESKLKHELILIVSKLLGLFYKGWGETHNSHVKNIRGTATACQELCQHKSSNSKTSGLDCTGWLVQLLQTLISQREYSIKGPDLQGTGEFLIRGMLQLSQEWNKQIGLITSIFI